MKYFHDIYISTSVNFYKGHWTLALTSSFKQLSISISPWYDLMKLKSYKKYIRFISLSIVTNFFYTYPIAFSNLKVSLMLLREDPSSSRMGYLHQICTYIKIYNDSFMYFTDNFIDSCWARVNFYIRLLLLRRKMMYIIWRW